MILPILATAALTPPCAPVPAGDGATERASLDSAGQQVSDDSMRPVVSADGLHVAFFSLAQDLVPGDTNGVYDAFVRDRVLDRTTRVSVGPGGLQANLESFSGLDPGRGISISANGRYVAFHSRASNLVAVDTNFNWDCFVHDRDPDQDGIFDQGNGLTTLVSVDSNGSQYATYPSDEPWISADGRYVAFQSRGSLHPADMNVYFDIYVRDRKLGLTHLVTRGPVGSPTDGDSFYPVISGTGLYVAYESQATNLVGGDLNGVQDVFATTWSDGFTRRVSVGPGGLEADGSSQGASISGSGLSVAYSSNATNLHPDDQNGKQDVFVHDIVNGLTLPISVRPGGKTADDDSLHPSISPDARYVAFESLATDMTPIESFHFRDVFVFDRLSGQMFWFSPADIGSFTWPHADGRSRSPSVSASGVLVAFESEAKNLLPGDTNDSWDVFVRVRSRNWHGPYH